MMRYFLIVMFCLFSMPTNAAIYSVPNNGDVIVYGDFLASPWNGTVFTSFSYTLTGGSFTKVYDYSDPSTLQEIEVGININGDGGIRLYDCNPPDAHCGRSNRGSTGFLITSWDGEEGIMHISSFVSAMGTGAELPTLEIFVSLPNGFTIDQVAAVPEPSTWLLMLLGFAGIGLFRLRRIANG